MSLEILRFSCEQVYEELYSHFLHKLGQDSFPSAANVLDAFVNYEAAKSSAGILLSTNDFNKLNPFLSKQWEEICNKLDIKEKLS
ncbi:hypothetical protein [Coleofasciculus sp. FACHB-SPT9]|uniref:hypothetical protein n=1 Tax=Cyanophyceae TaxID=3028117 RepID=UPI001682D3A1|nr:hypothetical protein [Coleofasciculus sp. FACHB-SPT9]MBD1892919.1 hypothetical protein [Coleofasciculus sp. FACHB-SPT9]